MIIRLCGILADIRNGQAFVELNGITYGVLVSRAVEERLIATGMVGQEVAFHIYHYIEGSVAMGNTIPRLVGFLNETDLEFFTMLITVQGLGVRKALKALVLPVKNVAKAIELNDTATLRKLPEIGRKTAEKIILELRGKTAKFALLREDELPDFGRGRVIESEYTREAIEILKQLQYSENEAREIVCRTAETFPAITTAEELIQEIFKRQAIKNRV